MTINLEYQPQTNNYNEKLNSLSSTFFSLIEDYKKYYVYTNKNPEVNEYQNFFFNTETQLQNNNKSLVDLINLIKNDIKELDKLINGINLKLSSEKDLNKELSKLVLNLKNENNGSSIMLDETTIMYNKQYLWNIEIFIGIIILCVLIANNLRNNNK
jgi:hypothetical protein